MCESDDSEALNMSFVLFYLGPVYWGKRAEAVGGQTEHQTPHPAPSGPTGKSPRQRAEAQRWWTWYDCFLLSSAEAREEEGGGGAEEAVGGPGAREDAESITILQRGRPRLLITGPRFIF